MDELAYNELLAKQLVVQFNNFEKYHYLLFVYCQNSYERNEMRAWINKATLDKAFSIIIECFGYENQILS
ncbi:hypothetical protein MKA27_13120 [[Clostridium] innocuum]|uniref:hypothetical protein n=1 Tax=Clostridium innocuum TaxID=1522 RepID=UPI000D6D9FAD|nr:hypothetical protein [[Clostridium] innocuum]MCR0315249.1 hypothetical protein [[Clostridium] innocuum]MCR0369729.1 hypothetical protein [[Clostridium] innocuum]MCR0374760.1 hypothetical protein [[Clostridium] innocuum]MCR0559682.1 hypothetical protein [[Clostridium] innocuum]MCR0602624.1 hypothetical protein [[Clostridium] innocuum]